MLATTDQKGGGGLLHLANNTLLFKICFKEIRELFPSG